MDTNEMRIEELEERLKDWEDTHRRIMSEECAFDEFHCTCVPSLRKRIAELEEELAEGDSWMARATHAQEMGTCVLCFATDEAGHKKSCEWGKAEARIEALDRALTFDRNYPHAIFTELSPEEMVVIQKALLDCGVRAACDRLHASWARFMVKAMRKEAEER